jgi:hypothetical protein
MSYGSSEIEYYRLVGNCTGKVLKGDRPGDLTDSAIDEGRTDDKP